MSRSPSVTVVGGGLAGCEAALQLARFGLDVQLVEMRPGSTTAAHRDDGLAEIVCSNSLKSILTTTGSGLLKAEMDRLGCRLLPCAHQAAVPAGAALAVDRHEFSRAVEARLAAEPRVKIVREALTELPVKPDHLWVVATGPLTSDPLVAELGRFTGRPGLHFYDAIAPTVTLESLDLDILFRAARYGKGDADYLNAPLTQAEYHAFHEALTGAEVAHLRSFDQASLFDGCQPLENIAGTGPMSMAFGPLRPVGLTDPRTGHRPHAVVQLRQENRAGTLYGLVGFQTQLKQGFQKDVFRMIPGLARAEFVRFGQLHRNFYLDSPACLHPDFSLKGRPDIFAAGQITGVEGYVESIASGLVTAWEVAHRLEKAPALVLPPETVLGGLLRGFLFDGTSARFSPMNANFGLLPDLQIKVRGKRERRAAKAERALQALETAMTRVDFPA